MAGIHDIAKAAGVKADAVVDIFEAIFQLVRAGEVVRVTGFGSFERKSFPGRTIESPIMNDGAPITFGDSLRVAFKQSTQAKRRLNLARKKKREAKALPGPRKPLKKPKSRKKDKS